MGGKSGKKSVMAADNLFNQDIIELGLAICEGTIEGLDNGLKSLYINNIPVESELGEYNFSDLGINFRQGYYDDLPVRYVMGGESSVISSSLGISLPANVPRTIITPPQHRGKIKMLDVRLIIAQLYAGDGKDVKESSVLFEVKYRKVGATEWRYVTETTGSLSEYKRKVATLRQEAESQGISWDALTPEQQFNFELNTLKELGNIISSDLDNIVINPDQVALEYNARSSFLGNAYARLFKIKFYRPLNQVYGDQVPGASSADIYNKMLIVNGKTTGGFVYELSIPIFDDDEDTHDWEIQIERKSRELTSDEKKYSGKTITLDSIAVVTEVEKKYTKTAVCHIVAQHTDRFSDIPDFTGDIKGFICEIPTNYNPISKTWAGTWDGYFKKGWTNNNALIARELIMNRDWGKRASEPQLQVDPVSLMEAIKYCDELVPDLDGNMKPRHTFNDAISAERDIDDYLKYILGSFHATCREISGVFRFFIDRKKTPNFFVTKETALQTGISYYRSDLASRYNLMRVSFKNKENNYEEDRRNLVDDKAQMRDGVIPYSFQAIGATNLSEAVRQAVYLMYTNRDETTFASFAQPRLGHVVNLYDHFYIADADMDWGTSARILDYTRGTGTINLRDPLVLLSGDELFDVYVHSYAGVEIFKASARDPYSLQIVDPYNRLAMADYLVENAPIMLGNDVYGHPKVFRVLSIEQSDSNDVAQGELFSFKSAIVSDLKYYAIDNINDKSLVDFTFNSADATYDRKSIASAPRNALLWLQDQLNDIGQLKYGIQFDPSQNAVRYEVTWVNKDTEEKRQTILYEPRGVLAPAFPEYTPLKLKIVPYNVNDEPGDVLYMDDVILSYPSAAGLPSLVSVTYLAQTAALRFSFTPPNINLAGGLNYTKMTYNTQAPGMSQGNQPADFNQTYVDVPYRGPGNYALQLNYLALPEVNGGKSNTLTTQTWTYYGNDDGSLPVRKYPEPVVLEIKSYVNPADYIQPPPAGFVYPYLRLKIPNISAYPDLLNNMTSTYMFFPFVVLYSPDNDGIFKRIGYIGGTPISNLPASEGMFSIQMASSTVVGNGYSGPDYVRPGTVLRIKTAYSMSGTLPTAPNWIADVLDSDYIEVTVPQPSDAPPITNP